MRTLIEFPCAGETLLGTFDEAAGTTGLLIVSGGNEIRIGAHRGMALLAAHLADAGIPVFRFDRRGIGDSTGENHGFAESAEDIAAAAAAFRAAAPHVTTLAAFGNCDAATALALFHKDAGIDRLILANPWVGDEADALPPATAIRARYAERLADPRQWLRLLKGQVNIQNLFRGLRKIAAQPSQQSNLLADRFAAAIEAAPAAVVLLAKRDATALKFAQSVRFRGEVHAADTASHSFAREADQQWLFDRILESAQPSPTSP